MLGSGQWLGAVSFVAAQTCTSRILETIQDEQNQHQQAKCVGEVRPMHIRCFLAFCCFFCTVIVMSLSLCVFLSVPSESVFELCLCVCVCVRVCVSV